jgi:hypothetical protein
MSEVRVKLIGEDAKLGEVPASDVAKLIIEVELALRRAAAAIIGRPKTATGGRFKQSIESAIRLRLRAVEEGSVVPVLELPDAAEESGRLDLGDEALGEVALRALLEAADVQEGTNPTVASALLEVADSVHVGDRYEAIEFKVAANGRPGRKARVDGDARRRLRSYVDNTMSPAVRPDVVVGVLFEADFEKKTARLRSPTNQVVEVRFDDDLADDIQAALRQQATLRGEVSYDPKDHIARSVALREVVRGEQLVLGLDADEFWREHTFAELAAIQGSGQPIDPSTLYDAEATDEEREAFMAALAELD